MPRRARGEAVKRQRTVRGSVRGTDGKVSRAETVYRGLRRAIIEQALSPGTKLPEDLVGTRFGVSRTVVRAALARLAAESLVELHLNRGATVAHPSLDEAHDVFDIRRSLERLVVERLAGRLSRADLARLKQHVAAEEQAKGRGGAESIRLAGEFHMLLAELAGSSTLSRYVGELISRSSLIRDLRPAAFARLRGDRAPRDHRRAPPRRDGRRYAPDGPSSRCDHRPRPDRTAAESRHPRYPQRLRGRVTGQARFASREPAHQPDAQGAAHLKSSSCGVAPCRAAPPIARRSSRKSVAEHELNSYHPKESVGYAEVQFHGGRKGFTAAAISR